MTKPLIALCCAAAIMVLAENDSQVQFALCMAAVSVIVMFVNRVGPGNTIAALDVHRWVIRFLWVALIGLAWMLSKEAPPWLGGSQ